jgi:predicted deacylase
MDPVSYAVEIEPTDISPYRAGNTGIEYVTTLESGRPGPHVMINALTHGNELCGAAALDYLFRHDVQPTRGTLTLSFANTAAYARFDPANPGASRFVEEDMNRVWAKDVLDGPRDSLELRRARVLRPLMDGIDYLFDIHSMQHGSPALCLAGAHAKGRALGAGTRVPGYVISDFGHTAGRRLCDYAHFDDPNDPRAASLIECGQHWREGTVALAIESSLRFLLHLDMIAPAFAAPYLPAEEPPPQVFVEVTEAVTIESERFTFADDYRGMEVIEKAGTPIGHDGDREIHTPYDDCVLVMPSRRLRKGLTAVRLGRRVD